MGNHVLVLYQKASSLGKVFVLILLCLSFCFSQSQELIDSHLQTFLKDDKELRSVYSCDFTGHLIPIPAETLEKLQNGFPQYIFHIAEMNLFTDLPPKKTKLVTFSSKETGKVAGFIWAGLWSMPSASLEDIVLGQKGSSEIALEKIRALAELLAVTDQLKLGSEVVNKKFVEKEIRLGDSVFRTIRLDLKNSSTLGKLTIRRQDGQLINQKE